jgi:hypothetical protein
MTVDPHTDAPESEAEIALVRQMVMARIGDAAGDSIVRLEAARGGLQYLTTEAFGLYVAAIRALDQLYQAVK